MNEYKENKTSADKTKPHQQISAKRLWLFRIIAATLIPIVLIALLEVALRIASYGYPASTFVKCEVNGKGVYCSNNKFGWRFFSPEISREISPLVVPAEKADNTYRIFILGASAARGEPEPSYNFGRILQIMLRQQYPGINFEVYTVAMPAINSHAVVLFAKDCARLKPDLFLVYLGNNEVVGPYGAGTVFSPLSKNLFLIRAGIAIKATKTGQLLNNLIAAMPREKGPETWGGLEMFLDKQIRHDDHQLQYVYSHFQQNIEDIALFATEAGSKIVFSTVAVNLKDCPPFASLHRPNYGEQKQLFDELYQKGNDLERAGDFQGAIEEYTAAEEVDDSYAELEFRLGRCWWNRGEFDKAGEKYAQARDLDTLRFRADSNINRIIRETATGKENKGIYLVGAVNTFERNSINNCPGFELFYEHVHFNFSGSYLLAKTFYEQIEQILPEKIRTEKPKEAGLPSERVCAEFLVFTDYDNLRLTEGNLAVISSKEPFLNQAYHDEMLDIWRRKTKQLKEAFGPDDLAGISEQYERAIKAEPADRMLRFNYANFLYKEKKNPYAAMEQYRIIINQVPHDHETLACLANMEGILGNLNSSLKHARQAIEIMPTDSTAHNAAGMAYMMMGKFEEAEKHFIEAIRLNPKFGVAYINLGKVLVQQNKFEKAEMFYRKGIEEFPDSASLHVYLALLLKQKGAFEEAEKEMNIAAALDPNVITVKNPPYSK